MNQLTKILKHGVVGSDFWIGLSKELVLMNSNVLIKPLEFWCSHFKTHAKHCCICVYIFDAESRLFALKLDLIGI